MMMIKTYSRSADTSLSERKKKKLHKRIERLLSTLQSDRKNYKSHLELGDLYASLEEVKDADKHYMTAVDILHQGAGDERTRKQIIVVYGKILSLEPNNYAVYTQLAQEYVASGQKEKASRFLLSSGKKAFENGDYELALQCYEHVIDLGKSNPYIIERCTEIFLKLGRKDDAIENYVRIGDMYAREEKAVEALEYYKKANALDPDSPDLILKVARMYYTLEWTENAAAEMVKIAEYHEQQQSFPEALKYFQHSLSLDRENDRALAGKLRISASHPLEAPDNTADAGREASQEDILDELDLIEDALQTQHFGKIDRETPEESHEAELLPSTETLPATDDVSSGDSMHDESEEAANNVIDAADIFSHAAAPATLQEKAPEVSDALKTEASAPNEANDFFQMDPGNSQPAEETAETPQTSQKEREDGDGIVWQDRLVDLNLEEDFMLMTGLEDQGQEDGPEQVPPFSIEEQPPLKMEDGTKETEPFEALEFPSPTEQIDKAHDVFEPAESIAETTNEHPVEEMPEEGQAEQTDVTPSVELRVEQNENLIEEPDAAPEAIQTVEVASIEEDAEKFITESLMGIMDGLPQLTENIDDEQKPDHNEIESVEEQEPQPSTPVDGSATEHASEEALAEPAAHNADIAEQPGPDEMPASYTPIQKPEKIPRKKFHGSGPELEQKLEDLEKQLENTEEEKYFLQEQFTAQISKLKSRDTLIKREYDRVRKDKDALQQRLSEVTSIYETSRQRGGESDEARYEAIVSKIQRKKQALQQHVSKLLKQREQNGRFLEEELKALGSTKLRLQSNLEYIQQVKARVEQKIHTDLRQAQEEIQQLSSRAMTLEGELGSKQKSEQHMQDQFDKLQQEKETLQDQFTETISALTEENEKLGEQFKELSKEKLETEHVLKKKFKAMYVSSQRLKAEFKASVQSKELELSRTAHRLSQFADEYVKLETTLKDIRKERDKLERMLAQETATRERLEDNLTDIESQVDSLEEQGSDLLGQLDEELDRQFTIEQSTSDEFQASLGELEQLLALQEKEIQHLEVF